MGEEGEGRMGEGRAGWGGWEKAGKGRDDGR